MKESIKQMRKTKWAYEKARQKRYDELADWDPYDSDAFEKHKEVAKRIDLEEHATEIESIDDPLMCTAMALIDRSGVLYFGNKEPYEPEKTK